MDSFFHLKLLWSFGHMYDIQIMQISTNKDSQPTSLFLEMKNLYVKAVSLWNGRKETNITPLTQINNKKAGNPTNLYRK